MTKSKTAIIMTAIAVMIYIAMVFGPKPDPRNMPNYGGYKFDFICIDGVEYLKYESPNRFSIAPHFNRDGSLVLCEEEAGEPDCGL